MNDFEKMLTALIEGQATDITPNTRMEQYLKNCCDKCGCDNLPTPRTRAEVLLYQLAKQLAGEGGNTGGDTPSGEKEAVIEPLEITENGTYTAPSGVDGYSPIAVNVASGGGSSGENKLAKVVERTATEITASDLEGATKIGGYAFYYYSTLKSIEIPNSVTRIGDYAFQNCSSLTNATIPNSVTSIDGRAFYNCTGLTSINIPDGVTSIGNSAFMGCTGLTSIEIPDSVTSIGMYAFQSCTRLTSITIPNSVTSIISSTFESCKGLTSVTIGSGVTSIGNSAFKSCEKITSITIPNSVTFIDQNAFYGCKGLTSVKFGSGLTTIGTSAFQNCTSMQYYDFTACTSVPKLANANAFTGIPSTCEIRVPMALVDEWKAATNWSTYASQIVGV